MWPLFLESNDYPEPSRGTSRGIARKTSRRNARATRKTAEVLTREALFL